MYIDTMQQVYSNVTKVMIDTHNNSNLLYLPLDKLMQQAGAQLVVPPAAAPPATPDTSGTPTGNVDVRSRENQRSRDRDGR
jgi:membrane protease subunit HflK